MGMLTIFSEEFLGANVLDDKPFILMPLVKNGNVRDYIDCNPDCNRQRVVSELLLFWILGASDNPNPALPCFSWAGVPSCSEYRAW